MHTHPFPAVRPPVPPPPTRQATQDRLSREVADALAAFHTLHGTLKFADRPGVARALGGKDTRPHHLSEALKLLRREGYAVLRDVSTYRQGSPGCHDWQPDTLYLVSRAELNRLQAERGHERLSSAPNATDLASLTGPDPRPRVHTDVPRLIFQERLNRARTARNMREGYPDSPGRGDGVWRTVLNRHRQRGSLMLGRPDDWNPAVWAALPRMVTVQLRLRTRGRDRSTGRRDRPVFSDTLTLTLRRTTRTGFLRLAPTGPEQQNINRLWRTLDPGPDDLGRDDSHEPQTLEFTLPGVVG